MKNLKDTILEKLKVDDIVLSEEFPIDGTLEDTVKFLEEQGFKDIIDFGTVNAKFDLAKTKCFHKKDNRLWFADTSKNKTSKKNPIFLIKYSSLATCFIVYYVEDGLINNLYNNDKKGFMKELNKQFSWQ